MVVKKNWNNLIHIATLLANYQFNFSHPTNKPLTIVKIPLEKP